MSYNPRVPSPPRKLVPNERPTSSVACHRDPLTLLTKHLLSWLLARLEGQVNVGLRRYPFAIRNRGQPLMLLEGDRVRWHHFASRSLGRAYLMARRFSPRPRRVTITQDPLSPPPSATPPLSP